VQQSPPGDWRTWLLCPVPRTTLVGGLSPPDAPRSHGGLTASTPLSPSIITSRASAAVGAANAARVRPCFSISPAWHPRLCPVHFTVEPPIRRRLGRPLPRLLLPFSPSKRPPNLHWPGAGITAAIVRRDKPVERHPAAMQRSTRRGMKSRGRLSPWITPRTVRPPSSGSSRRRGDRWIWSAAKSRPAGHGQPWLGRRLPMRAMDWLLLSEHFTREFCELAMDEV